MSLLDCLANICHCFISDLVYHYSLNQLKAILAKIPLENYSMKEWNQTFLYLFNKSNFTTYEEIHDYLSK